MIVFVPKTFQISLAQAFGFRHRYFTPHCKCYVSLDPMGALRTGCPEHRFWPSIARCPRAKPCLTRNFRGSTRHRERQKMRGSIPPIKILLVFALKLVGEPPHFSQAPHEALFLLSDERICFSSFRRRVHLMGILQRFFGGFRRAAVPKPTHRKFPNQLPSVQSRHGLQKADNGASWESMLLDKS